MNMETPKNFTDYLEYHHKERNRLQDLLSFSEQRDPVILEQWREQLRKHNKALEYEEIMKSQK